MKYSKELHDDLRFKVKYLFDWWVDNSEIDELFDTLLDEIERLQAERRWIPVSERFPEYGHAVLIMTTTSVLPRIGRHSPTIPQWSTTDLLYYHDISYSQVTHWMPLPSSPESED